MSYIYRRRKGTRSVFVVVVETRAPTPAEVEAPGTPYIEQVPVPEKTDMESNTMSLSFMFKFCLFSLEEF